MSEQTNGLAAGQKKRLRVSEISAWQKKRLYVTLMLFLGVSLSFLAYAVISLYQDKKNEDKYWKEYLTIDSELQEKIDYYSTEASYVSIGTYIENLKEINLKNNSFTLDYLIWFNWEGNPDLDMANNFRIYKGNITKKEVVEDYHEGNINYQLVRITVTVSKVFWTPRFPLESHQLRIYVEANHPVDDIVFVKDEDSSVNPNINIAGYETTRIDSAVVANEYLNNNGDPRIENAVIKSEYVTQLEIARSDMGIYLKCFIALFGTSVWVFIVLYINTKHRVDPLGMIPAALFGTVSNIMVGANLLPDALQIGLLEYVNFWGILTILSVALTVINVNRIRSKYEDREYAHLYGEIMFAVILGVIIAGHILMPLAAFKFK